MGTIVCSFFGDDKSYRSYYILKMLEEAQSPLGSWVLQEKLAPFEIELSIASIGRILRKLDSIGLTELVENYGRIITEKGSDRLRSIERDFERFTMEEDLIKASNPTDRNEFLDLLHARKVLEIETARLAATHATQKDLKNLEIAINEHANHISENNLDTPEIGCNFHEQVAKASHNRFLSSTLKLLIYEEVEIERKFSYPSTTSQAKHYIEAHLELLQAIKRRDEKQAMHTMEKHMSNLMQEIETYFNEPALVTQDLGDEEIYGSLH